MFEIVGAVVVGDFLVRLDVTKRPDEHATTISIAFRVRIAGMIGVAREIAARRAVDGDAGVYLVEVAIAAPFAAAGFLRTDTRTFVFDDLFPFLDPAGGEEAEPGERAADTE